MKLPKPQRSAFMYEMFLLFECMDNHLLKYIPTQLLKQLSGDEMSSLLGTLLINSTEQGMGE